MSDESIIGLSDSTKATMRNYAMVAGFMTLFIYTLSRTVLYFSGDPSFMSESDCIVKAITALSLMVFGSTLAFLHKRDLVSITFLIMGLYNGCTIVGSLFGNVSTAGACSHLIVMIVLGTAMLFTRNEQKYICALVLIPGNILRIAGICMDLQTSVIGAGMAIIAAVSLYAVLCIGLENPGFPGYRMLTADEEDEKEDGSPVHFKVSGSILGYSLMMVPMLAFILYRLNIIGITYEDFQAYYVSCGLMLILTGSLMLTAGRMKFTPFMFMMLGIVMTVQPTLSTGWMIAVFLIVIALLCVFRSDRRILVGIAILLYAAVMGLAGILPGGVSIALVSIQLVILTYVCFALCSDDRLKLI